jgi:hypothetical protein
LIAVLGEISGPEMAAELLELADDDKHLVELHTSWALWRLGQRHPKDVLRILREAAPSASLAFASRFETRQTRVFWE